VLTAGAHYNAYPMTAENVPHQVKLLVARAKEANETPKPRRKKDRT